jgi:hypothetical protein
MAHRYTTQIVSDCERDGLGVELLSEDGDIVSEVFRSDRHHIAVLNTFCNDIPLEAIERLIARAKLELDPFEDGTPLTEAVLIKPRPIKKTDFAS